MIYLRALASQAAASKARADYRTGYDHAVGGLNPPNPDDLSTDYWMGYSKGAADAHAMLDYYPDAHEGRGF